MYTILVTDEHGLLATQKERIMQRSKMADKMHFLVPPTYDEMDMSSTTVCLEYLTPVGREYKSEILTCSADLYKDHLEYILPFDTKLTREAGDLQIQLTFTNVSMDEDGNISQYVRKTSPTSITIVPISAWSDIIPDSALSALDQRLLKLDAQTMAIADYMDTLGSTKADNLVYNKKEDTLQLSANGITIGDKVSIKDMLNDGVPVVDLNSADGSTNPDTENNGNCNCEDNVVEFYDIEPELPEKDSDNVVEF